MNQIEFDKVYGKYPRGYGKTSVVQQIRKNLTPKWFKNKIYQTIPILDWLPKYDFKNNFFRDLIGGCTVGIMHVPQGMAYATLAGVKPIYGLYSSFFASLIYMFFGTCRHVSIGTFAVGSMLVGSVRYRLIPEIIDSANVHSAADGIINNATMLDNNEEVMTLLSTLTFGVGIVQLLMGIFRLSFLTTYMSDALIAGYTTATAAHVLISQLNKVLGVKLPRYNGNGMLFFMLRDIIMAIPNANIMAVAISAFGLTFLYIGKEYINPFVKKRSPLPIPFELLLVIFGIIFSTLLNVSEKYHISIVNTIPQGLPEPHLPDITLLPKLIPDCITIGIICYIFVVSLGKLFAKKHGYKIDPTQELFALGFMEIFSSFLPVYPAGAALSRSSVCEASGVKTQFYTVFTSILLLIVILWLGPLLEPLPMCILSCIVIISLKSLFLQVKQLPQLWKISKFDFAVWVIACVSTICTTVTLGLIISFIVVLLTVVLQQQWPKFVTYGTDENFEAFYPFKAYEKLLQLPHGAKLFKFEGPLHFANSVKFVDTLLHLITFESETMTTELLEVKATAAEGEDGKAVIEATPQKNIILDCSAMVFIDSMGFEALLEVTKTAKKHNTTLIFAAFPTSVLAVFDNADFYKSFPKENIFPSVHHAVQYLKNDGEIN